MATLDGRRLLDFFLICLAAARCFFRTLALVASDG